MLHSDVYYSLRKKFLNRIVEARREFSYYPIGSRFNVISITEHWERGIEITLIYKTKRGTFRKIIPGEDAGFIFKVVG